MTSTTVFWQEYEVRWRGYTAKRVSDRDAVDESLQDGYLKAHAGLRLVGMSRQTGT